MVPKDYYLILGVSRSESPSGIRARYRDLVRRVHPDVAGAQSTGAFQDIAEAYEVLADPAARRRYNAELDQREARQARENIAPRASWRRDPISLLGEPKAVRPSFEAFVERLFEALTLEVILTPEEAARGVIVPIAVPRLHECPDCRGAGHIWLFPCSSCAHEGVVAGEEIVQTAIPPVVGPAAVFEWSLRGLGIHNLYLRLYVRVV
jgi:molecular chaperone DnaJ